MKRHLALVLGVGLLLSVCVAGHSALAQPKPKVDRTLLITSGPSWRTWHDGRLVGDAQNYCLNASYPPNCPPGATVYGFGSVGWTADLSPIPGATWIWAPGITGRTPNASGASFTFKRKITLHGAVVSGTVYVAADDWARINVNGTWVASWGSVTDFDEASLANTTLSQGFDITPYLTQGVNRISVWDENGPDWFAGCSSPCDYARNPAGVAFGLSITVQHSSPVPSPRGEVTMAYDPATHQTIMFGGLSSSNVALGDTWAWNGKRWDQLHPATSPPARYLAGMAYDGATGHLIMFGGGDCYGCFLNGTWAWTGTNWVKRYPRTVPPAQQSFGMAYDAATQQVVMTSLSGNCTPSTWTWDGTNWTERHPAQEFGCLNGMAMAYDPVRQQVIMFGGWNGNEETAETWMWDGSNWHQLAPATSPPPRGNMSMVYDADLQRIVLFGGFPGFGPDGALNDTWAWDGTNWTQLQPTTSPSPRVEFGMAYDDVSKKIVVFGGRDTLNGTPNAETWTLHRPWTGWVQH